MRLRGRAGPADGQRAQGCGGPTPRYPGLHDWWTRAEALWLANRSSERLTLIQQFNYRGKLSSQFTSDGACPGIRIVYSKSGMYLAAAVVTDPTAVIDHGLYWAACSSLDEGRYLCAVLNSERVTLAVRAFQGRGEHNPRHFDTYVWQLPIPAFAAGNALHARLVTLGGQAEAFAATLALPQTRFEKQRRFVREQLAASDVGRAIEAAVRELLEDRV